MRWPGAVTARLFSFLGESGVLRHYSVYRFRIGDGLDMFCCALLWQSRPPATTPSKAVAALKQGSTRHRVETDTDGRFTILPVDASETALQDFQPIALSAIGLGAAGDLRIHLAHRLRGVDGPYAYMVVSR
jgi:hypothetical protein